MWATLNYNRFLVLIVFKREKINEKDNTNNIVIDGWAKYNG